MRWMIFAKKGVIRGQDFVMKIYSLSHVSVTAIMLGDFEHTNDWNCSNLLTMLLALVYITVSQLESDAGLSTSSMAELSLEGLNTSALCFGTKPESVISP